MDPKDHDETELELLQRVHAACAKHADRHRATTHTVALVLDEHDMGFGRWIAVATFGGADSNGVSVTHVYDDKVVTTGTQYVKRGRDPRAALLNLIAELRRPDLDALATSRGNLAALAELPATPYPSPLL